MTYQEFKNKYNEKYIDVDNQYGAQCWDLAQRYFTECLKLPASVLGGCGLVSNMLYQPKRAELDKYFYEVPGNDMHSGDVVIWEYGHIAIFDHWDGKQCWYFSQNPNPCRAITINRGGAHAFRLRSEEPTKNVNVYYRVKTKDYGWLDEVKNLEDYAGWNGSPIIDIAIKVDKGSVWYQAHIKGGNWLPKVTGYNINDFYNGYAGEDKPIDCIRVYYNTPSDIRPYKRAKYKVNNFNWQYDDEYDKYGENFAGMYGTTATEFRIIIE